MANVREKQPNPTANPVARLDSVALKRVAEEGLKLRREIEKRTASMAMSPKRQQAQARMK